MARQPKTAAPRTINQLRVLKYRKTSKAARRTTAEIIPDLVSEGTIWLMGSINQMSIRTKKLNSAALIWFSVAAEIKIPKEI